jgi:hypothetical protein
MGVSRRLVIDGGIVELQPVPYLLDCGVSQKSSWSGVVYMCTKLPCVPSLRSFLHFPDKFGRVRYDPRPEFLI